MILHIPEFRAMAVCNQHLNHGAFDIDLGPDVVKVVRCKECKHYRDYGKTSLLINAKNVKAGWCKRRTRYDEECRMLPDDFCSYGEAR